MAKFLIFLLTVVVTAVVTFGLLSLYVVQTVVDSTVESPLEAVVAFSFVTYPPELSATSDDLDDPYLLAWYNRPTADVPPEPRVIDVEAVPVHELQDFLAQWPHLAVYYHNIHTGFSFAHNGERDYFAASLTKAPFAFYIYTLAEAGLTDLNSLHPFTPAYRTGGSGIIRHAHRYGDLFSQQQLLGYNLYLSDNIATRMLRGIHGYQGLTQFATHIGANPHNIRNITYSRTTARDAAIWMLAMYDFIATGSPYGQMLLEHLLNNHFPFLATQNPRAGKTGWFPRYGGAWHEMSIVYAPSPFVLVVLSNNYGGDDTPIMQAISLFIEDFNQTWFE